MKTQSPLIIEIQQLEGKKKKGRKGNGQTEVSSFSGLIFAVYFFREGNLHICWMKILY